MTFGFDAGANDRAFDLYKTLPNNELSHENLFKTLERLFEYDPGTGCDHQGLHVLKTVIDGAQTNAFAKPSSAILADFTENDYISDEEKDLVCPARFKYCI